MDFAKFLIMSLPNNLMILICAVVAGCCLYISNKHAKTVEKYFEEDHKDKLQKDIYYMLDREYTLFIALISIFPLLGMFGTVQGIINMGNGLTSEDIEGTANFSVALGSTAWGIIFSVIFKLINAGFQPFIENQIKKAKQYLDL